MAGRGTNTDRQLREQLVSPPVVKLLGVNAIGALEARMGSGAGGGPAVSPLTQREKEELLSTLGTYNATYSFLDPGQKSQLKASIETRFARSPAVLASAPAALASSGNSSGMSENSDSEEENADFLAAMEESKRGHAPEGPQEPLIDPDEGAVRTFLLSVLGINIKEPILRLLNPDDLLSNANRIDIRCYIAALHEAFRGASAEDIAALNALIAEKGLSATLSWERIQALYERVKATTYFFPLSMEGVSSPFQEQGNARTFYHRFPAPEPPLVEAAAKVTVATRKYQQAAGPAKEAAKLPLDQAKAALREVEEDSFRIFQEVYEASDAGRVIKFADIKTVAQAILPKLPSQAISIRAAEPAVVAREKYHPDEVDIVPKVCAFRDKHLYTGGVISDFVRSIRMLGSSNSIAFVDNLIKYLKQQNGIPLRTEEIPPEGLGMVGTRAPVTIGSGFHGHFIAELAKECAGMQAVPTIGDGSCLVHALLTLTSKEYRCATPSLSLRCEVNPTTRDKKDYRFIGERDLLGKLFRKCFFTQMAFSVVSSGRPVVVENCINAYEFAFADDTNLYLEEMDVNTFVQKYRFPLLIFRNGQVTFSSPELSPTELRPLFIGAIANMGIHYEAVRWDGEFMHPYALFLAKNTPTLHSIFEYQFIHSRFRSNIDANAMFQNSVPGAQQSAERMAYEHSRFLLDSLSANTSRAEMAAAIPDILAQAIRWTREGRPASGATLAKPPHLGGVSAEQEAAITTSITNAWLAALEPPYPVEQNGLALLYENEAFAAPEKQKTLDIFYNILQKSPVFSEYKKTSKLNPAGVREVALAGGLRDFIEQFKEKFGSLMEMLRKRLDEFSIILTTPEEEELIASVFTEANLLRGVIDAGAGAGGGARRNRKKKTHAHKGKKQSKPSFTQTRKKRQISH